MSSTNSPSIKPDRKGNQDFQPSRRRSRPGFTLIELLLVVAIIAILMSILLPALKQVKESGRLARCLSNLRQLGISTNYYVNDYNEWLPEGYDPADIYWFYLLESYDNSYKSRRTGANGTYTCPSFNMFWGTRTDWSGNYGQNDDFIDFVKITKIKRPSTCCWIMDSYKRDTTKAWIYFEPSRFLSQNWDGQKYYYHNQKCAVSFIAGNCESYTPSGAANSYHNGEWKYPQP